MREARRLQDFCNADVVSIEVGDQIFEVLSGHSLVQASWQIHSIAGIEMGWQHWHGLGRWRWPIGRLLATPRCREHLWHGGGKLRVCGVDWHLLKLRQTKKTILDSRAAPSGFGISHNLIRACTTVTDVGSNRAYY